MVHTDIKGPSSGYPTLEEPQTPAEGLAGALEVAIPDEAATWVRTLAALSWGAVVIGLMSLMLAGALPVFHALARAWGE